jgi:hypothetical protein
MNDHFTSQEPVAWARFFPNGGPQSVYLDRPPPDAEPLYRKNDHIPEAGKMVPALTDAEREAISEVVDCLTETGTALANPTTARNTLADLLARLA